MPPGPQTRHFGAEEMMKKTALLLTLAILLMPASMFADDAKATFEAKCKMCHGASLEKKPIDTSKADDVLVKFLMSDAKHKSKVADEAAAKALVAYIKSIKK
jgi:cytochrome c553